MSATSFSQWLLISAAICALAAAGEGERQPGPPPRGAEPSLIGRLHAVDPAGSRLLIVPDGRKEMVEIQVTSRTDLRLGSSRVELRALLSALGSRVKVRYRLESGGRLAGRLITVDPPRRR